MKNDRIADYIVLRDDYGLEIAREEIKVSYQEDLVRLLTSGEWTLEDGDTISFLTAWTEG